MRMTEEKEKLLSNPKNRSLLINSVGLLYRWRKEVVYSEMFGWEAGIRTPISRSRVCGPTVGRRPNNGKIVTERLKRMLPLGVLLQMGSRFAGFPTPGGSFNDKIRKDGAVHQSFYIGDGVVG